MNILLIMADQFAAHALERVRPTDQHFRTPNLDRLAAVSTSFTQAYTPFPLCVPARSSLVTGRYPHQLGITSNAGTGAEPGRSPESLGHWFTAAGHDCAYAGKWHARLPSATPADGFAPIHPFGDEGLVAACTQWLDSRDDDRPFLLVASFDDPHTICEFARAQPMPYGNVPVVPAGQAPPLPANFPPGPYAASAPAVEKASADRVYGTAEFGPDDWRQSRAAYAALVERTDARIGELLAAVDLDTTAVVFVSDHGDGDASHAWNQKTALHLECVRVPLLVHLPGGGQEVESRPVPAVLGMFATLCGIAGIAAPAGLAAGSVLDEAAGDVVIQCNFADTARANAGAPTAGRALVHGRYKYTVYSWGMHREQLHDVIADPGEQRNLAMEDGYGQVLEEMRGRLLDWALDTGDTAFLKKLVLPATAPGTVHRQLFNVPY